MAIDTIKSTAIFDGAVTSADLDTNIAVSGNLSSGGALTSTGQFKANGGVVINEDSLDVDFRVESNGNANTLFVDGGTDRVGIKTATPGYELEIATNSGTTSQRISRGGNYLDFGGLSSGTIYMKGYEGVVAVGNAYTGALDLLTSDTAQARITSSGNMGIGTTSPGQKLEVNTGNDSNGIRIRRFSGSYYSDIVHTSSPEGLKFMVGDGSSVTERLRILGTGGITFNGDTATANALDDYEEGTWTPAFSFTNSNGGHTTANAAGHYLKIGSFAYVQGYVYLSAKNSASGDCRIGMGSLPFTPRSTANYTYVGVYINNATGDFQGNNQMFGQVAANDATLRMYASQGGGNIDQLNAVDLQNGTDFRFSGWIPVN